MRTTRYIRRSSGARLWRDPIAPLPAASRASSASYAPAPEYSSQTYNYYPRHHSQPHAPRTKAQAPLPRHTPRNHPSTTRAPDPRQSSKKVHHELWHNFALTQGSAGHESEPHLGASSDKASERRPDEAAPGLWRDLDWHDGSVWQNGFQMVRRGEWDYQPESAPMAALLHYKTADEVRHVWAEQDVETTEKEWAPILLTLLATNVRQACLFLQALCPLSQPHVRAMRDSFNHIQISIASAPPRYRDSVAEHLCDAVVHQLREHPKRGVLLKQQHIYHLQKILRPRRVAELYDEIGRAGIRLETYTLMHIISALSKDPGQKRKALEIMGIGLRRLRAIDHPDSDEHDELKRLRWASVFTTVLKTTQMSVANPDAVSPDQVWGLALDNGMAPNTMHLTALVHGLFAIGEADAAWQAFDLFVGRCGLPVDMKLATALLQGSKLAGSMSDVQRALDIMADTRDMDEWAGNNILHLLLSMALSDSTNIVSSFRLMVHVYSRIFRASALEAMIPEKLRGVVDPNESFGEMVAARGYAASLDRLFDGRDGELLEPTPATLEIMVLSWICSLKREIKGPALTAFYGHYRGMLREGHPVAAAVVETKNTVIHDMIIKGMTTTPTHLRTALEVIADMLRDHEDPAADPAGDHAAPRARPTHPRPTAWTWNILLDAWMRNFKQDNIGRIVGLMKRHGVEPSLVTWNTILTRAAQRRNTELAVTSARAIREGGYEPNEWTVKAFSRLAEKEMFLSEMQGGKWMGGGVGARAVEEEWGAER